MKKYTLFFAMMLLAVMPILQAQPVQITGKVISTEDGNPVPGISVVVEGTTTDIDGNYSLNVPNTATTIVFSFLGLKSQEVAIGGRTSIDIVMEQDVVGLEEVVVTALGITRSKKALGYSVSEFNSEDMERSQVLDATRALQGRVAGVTISSSSGAPGASTSIFVRGLASITQSNQPLYVVDGVPVNNQFNSGNSTQATTNANLTVDFGNAASDINPADNRNSITLKANGGSDKTRIGFSASFTNKKISAVSTGQGGEDAGGGKAVFQEIMQNPVNHYIPFLFFITLYNLHFDNKSHVSFKNEILNVTP